MFSQLLCFRVGLFAELGGDADEGRSPFSGITVAESKEVRGDISFDISVSLSLLKRVGGCCNGDVLFLTSPTLIGCTAGDCGDPIFSDFQDNKVIPTLIQNTPSGNATGW